MKFDEIKGLKMVSEDRSVVIAGNWKMYKTLAQAITFVDELIPLVADALARVYLAVPFTAINPCTEKADDSNIVIGAQNMYDASEGAFTGEIGARMLIDAGAKFVLLGHSERRRYFHETNEFINKKMIRAVSEGLQPILCIGETLQEHEEGKMEEVLSEQLSGCLAGLKAMQLENLILAYEPVWAIGTDKTATPEEAQTAHQFCREHVAQLLGEELANKLVIQYGGSVKPENASELLDQPDIDGLLVGGASLSVDSFSKIVNSYKGIG